MIAKMNRDGMNENCFDWNLLGKINELVEAVNGLLQKDEPRTGGPSLFISPQSRNALEDLKHFSFDPTAIEYEKHSVLKAKDEEIARLNKVVENYQRIVAKQSETAAMAAAPTSGIDPILAVLSEEIINLRNKIQNRDRIIDDKNKDIERLRGHIEDKQVELGKMQVELNEKIKIIEAFRSEKY